jgi:hypothetical protein
MELASFVEYLQYKSTRQKEVNNHGSSFLMSIAGLGASAETDVSEQDEDILKNEIDSVRGWGLKADGRDFGFVRPRHCDYFELLP